MKRSMCGGFLLATLAGMLACSGDPTGDLVGKNLTIQADPRTVFVSQGSAKPVTVSVVDEQGNEAAITGFQATASSGDISVADDSTFLPSVIGQLPTSRRVNVTGVNPAAATMTLTANGKSMDVPVVVGPVTAPVTLSANAVPVNVPITFTIQGPYKFGAGAGATVNGTAGLVLGVSADSATMTLLPPPGASGPLVLDSVAPTYAPTLRFSVPTGDSVTVDSLTTPLTGTGSPSTAPSLSIGPAGTPTGAWDLGTFTAADITADGGLGAQYYKLPITEAGTYSFSVNWSNDADIDIELCSDATCSDGGDFLSTGIDQPEADSRDLVPGTYYLAVVLFDGSPPPLISIALSH
jgi:hypothetical protein